MTSLILLNHLVPDIDILKNAIKVPYVESEQLVSDIINSEPGTHELDQNIVNNILNLDSSITTIALLYENIGVIPDGFEALCASLPQHIKTIDLLTCNLNDEESITTLKTLESRYNKIIRYSVDLTGHEDSMGNWMLESHNVEVRNIYFNNKITEWKHVLSTSPETSEPLVYPDQTIYGNVDFSQYGSGSRYHYNSNFENTTFVEHSQSQYGFVNLSHIHFDYSNFQNADMRGANMYGTQFTHCNMKGANFQDKRMASTSFTYADLTTANFYNSRLINPDFSGATLTGADLRYANMEYNQDEYWYAKFIGSDLTVAKLNNANLTDANFSGATLSYADLSGATLTGVKSGPLNGETLLSLPSGYKFVPGTNEQWIVGPDVNLSGADLRGMDLSGVDLSGVNLSGAKTWPLNGSAPSSLPPGYDFISGDYQNGIIGPGVDLSDVHLFGADLSGTDLSGADLSGVTLTGVKSGPLVGSAPISLPSDYNFVPGTNEQWIVGPGVDLTGADLSGMDLSSTNLSGADLSGADLSGMDLSSTNLSGADLSGVTLTRVKSGPLVGSAPSFLPSGYKFVSGTNENLIVGPGVDLSGVDLRGAYLIDTDLSGAVLSGAVLSGVDLSADLTNAKLNNATLTNANLSGATLTNADLNGATLSGVKSGPLDGSAPISLPSDYNFVLGTNEQWIVGPNVNLDGIDLSGMELNGMNLSGADLSGIDLSGMDLSGATLTDANLSDVDLYGLKTGPLIGSAPSSLPSGYKFVPGTNEKWIVGPNVNLDGVDLSGMDLSSTNLSGVDLSGLKTGPLVGSAPISLPSDYNFVPGTNENWIVGPGADLSGIDLSGMDLSSTNLSGVDLSGVTLSGAKTGPLVGSAPSSLPSGYKFVLGTNEQWIIGPSVNLDGVDLSGMNLSGVDLSGVDLSGLKTGPLDGSAPISLPSDYNFVPGTNENWIIGPGVDLSGADLIGMNLSNIELSGVKTGPLVSTASFLPDGYEFVSGTNETWIFGPSVVLSGADLIGMNLSNIELSGVKTGPLVSTASFLPDGYEFVSGTNEQWIFGPYVNLDGADISGMDLSNIDLSTPIINNLIGQFKNAPLSVNPNIIIYNNHIFTQNDNNLYSKLFEPLPNLIILNSQSNLTYTNLSNKIIIADTDEIDINNINLNFNTIDNTKFVNVKFNNSSVQHLQNKSVALIDCTVLE